MRIPKWACEADILVECPSRDFEADDSGPAKVGVDGNEAAPGHRVMQDIRRQWQARACSGTAYWPFPDQLEGRTGTFETLAQVAWLTEKETVEAGITIERVPAKCVEHS